MRASWRSGARTSVSGALALALALAPVARAQAPTEGELLAAEVKKLEEAYKRPGADRGKLRAKLSQILRYSDDPRLVARGLRIQLDLEPDNEEARRELASYALILKRPQVSIRLYKKVVAARPADLKARVGLGYAYQTLDRNKEALATFEEVVRRDGKNVEALTGSASSFLSLNKPEAALKRAQAALKLDPANKEARKLMNEASKEIAEGRIDAAGEKELTPVEKVAELRTRLVEKPGDRALRKKLGEALIVAGWAGEARLEYLSLLKDGKADVDILLGLSRAHRELGDPSGGRLYGERAVRAAPKSAQAQLEMARVWWALGNRGLARKGFENAMALERDFSTAFMEAGLFELEQNKLKAAEKLLDRANRLDPDDATILAAFAQVRFLLGKKDEAEALLKRARTLDPKEPLGWRLVAESHERAHLYRDAAQAWREYLFFSPFDAEIWLRLGRALGEAGDDAGAAKAIDVAFSLDDEDPAILDGVDSAIRALPFRRDLEALQLLVQEKRAYILLGEGDLDGAVRLLEGLAEERARQIRRVDVELEDPNVGPENGQKQSALRNLLTLTKAKVRVHESLAELYLDLERDDDVEKQYHELRHLDPGSAEVVRKLAQFYYDRGDSRRTVAWYKALPKGTRLTAEEKLQYAQSLDERGREEQAEKVYRDMAKTEAPMDEVEEALGDHNARKGNEWGSYRHYRRAVSLYGHALGSLESIRARDKSVTPDAWLQWFTFDDSDGIDIRQYDVGGRVVIDRKTDAAFAVSRYKLEDRFTPELEDTGFQYLIMHEISERFRVSALLGTVRFSTDGGLAWDLRLDWNPDDRFHVWTRFFQDSINETPLASQRGFEQTGFELDGTWFAHHRYRLGLHLEETQITSNNHRSIWNLDLGMRPLGPKLPGWLHVGRGNLDYDRRVAPALYFAPDDLARSDVYYVLPFDAGGVFLQVLWGLHNDFGFGLTHRTEVSATFDQGKRGNIGLEYKSVTRDRSYHDFTRDFRSDELTVQYNAQF